MMNSTYASRLAASLAVVLALSGSAELSAQRGQRRGYGQGRGQSTQAMSGTYELESSRGDDPRRVAEDATRTLREPQRSRMQENLLARLDPPQSMSIDRRGNGVTISSSAGPQTTFDVDGRTRNERAQNNRIIATRAEFVGDRLTVTSRGNRDTDFVVTFEPVANADGADGLLVTRQMDNVDLRRPVVLRSYYRRVSAEPRWDLYSGAANRDRGRADMGRPSGPAEGTRLTAMLENRIDTNTARAGDRITMTVRDGEFRDALVIGAIGGASPNGDDRKGALRIEFRTLRLRDGREVPLDAIIDTVVTPNGESFRVDTADSKQQSRTADTVQKGAIGATLGAIIGAVAGGGKGAAIGAVVGGAGGVIVAQNREQNVVLPPGTLVTILVTSHYRNP